MKRMLVSALLMGVAMLAIPAPASALEYYFDVSCGLSADSPASHVCESDDQIGAFFESDEATGYEVCVEFPSGSLVCSPEQLAEANVLYVNQITTNQLGEHRAMLWIDEELVDLWDFLVVEPPKPPPPPPPPPAAAPAAAPPPPPAVVPQVSTQCVKARRNVTRLRSRLRKAIGRQQKASLRARLRGARAAVRRAC